MKVTAMEARRRFGELLNRVLLAGEEIIIERAGKQVARLTSISDEPVADTKEHIVEDAIPHLDFRHTRGLGQAVWSGIDPDMYVREERGEW